MTLYRPLVHLDGISLGYHYKQVLDEDGTEWILTNFTGWWDGPPVRTNRTDRPSGSGSFRGPAYRGARVITIEGTMTARDEDSLQRARDRITGWCANQRELHPLQVDEINGARFVDVELDDQPITKPRTPWSDTFSLQVAAPDPRKYGPWESTSTGMAQPGIGGVDASDPGASATEPGLSAGEPASTGVARVFNSGTADSSPLLTVQGPVVRPVIREVDTGTSLSYSGTLAAGEFLVINTGPFAAKGYPGYQPLLGGTANRRNLLTRDGPWPLIPAGGTAGFALDAMGLDPNALLIVEHRQAWH